jgi:hypothetical protein
MRGFSGWGGGGVAVDIAYKLLGNSIHINFPNIFPFFPENNEVSRIACLDMVSFVFQTECIRKYVAVSQQPRDVTEPAAHNIADFQPIYTGAQQHAR